MPRSFLKTAAIAVFAVLALYSLILVPTYEIVACDVMLMNTLWFDAVDLLMQWTEIFGLILMLVFLTVGVYHVGDLKKCAPLFYLLGGALLFKYLGAIIALSVVHGSFDITLDYSGYAVSILLELLPCVIVTWLTQKHTANHTAQIRELEGAAALLKKDFERPRGLLPFQKLFGKENPLQKTAYIGVGIVTAARLASFVASEIAYSMLGFAYQLRDLPISLLYALLLVLLPCFLGYLVFFYALRLVEKKYSQENDNTQKGLIH